MRQLGPARLLSALHTDSRSGSVVHLGRERWRESGRETISNNPNKRANSAWDGRRVKIFGARNEIIAFQLVIEADPSGIDRLTVTLPQLIQKGGKARITTWRRLWIRQITPPPYSNIFRQLHEC